MEGASRVGTDRQLVPRNSYYTCIYMYLGGFCTHKPFIKLLPSAENACYLMVEMILLIIMMGWWYVVVVVVVCGSE